MNALNVLNVLNMAPYSIGAVLVCLTCLVYMMLHRRFDKSQSKLLLAAVIVLAVNALSSMTAEILKPDILRSDFATWGVLVSNYVYFVAHTFLAPLMCLYFLVVCGRSKKRKTLGYVLTSVPFVVSEFMAIVNPLTHWVYYYGPGMTFTRNWAVYILYAVAAFYILFGVVALLRTWRALTPVKRRAIAYFFIMVCLGVLVQLVKPEVRIELFAESIAILGVMIFVENEDDRIDSETDVYNRQALKIDLDSYTSLGRPFYVIAVRVSNADAFNQLGRTILTANALASILADYFKLIVPWFRVYRTAPTRFVLIDPDMSAEQANDLSQVISQRFLSSWKCGDVDVNLHAVVALACVPDDLPEPDDVFYLVDTPVPPVANGSILQGEGLNYLVRRASVERAVQRGFDEDGYEVHYQPVVGADGAVHAVEALMRLHDRELGNVPPFEFIEVAERLALIEDIGEIALRQVCAFIASGEPARLGIESINVNLSVIECMQTDFVDRMRSIISEYGIDSRLVGFEITESVAAADYDFLAHVMGELKADGHRFSMDDFGTGYSNMRSLLSLDFDVVKIDKSVLWEAEKSKTGRVILENSVTMLRNADSRVLVEGVETEGQLQLLYELGVDYFQGFYFAKPMSQADLLAYIESRRV